MVLSNRAKFHPKPEGLGFHFDNSRKLGNPTAALRDIETVFELNPDKVIECAARTQRAEILMGQNLNMEAFAELTIAIELDNSDAEAHKLRGVVSNQLKEYRIAHYDLSVIPLWSPTSEHYLLRSEACRGLEYLKNADNDRFISVVLQQPRLEKTLNDAIGALNAEHYEEAITLFEKTVSLLPQDVSEILCLLGKAKLELNRTEAAIADFDRAIAADPLHNFEALLCRAKALVDADADDVNHSQITADYMRIITREIDTAKVYMTTGVLKLNAGDPVIALAYLNAAMEISGNIAPNPELSFYRGLAKVRMKNYDGTLLDFDRAIEIKKDEKTTIERVVNFGLRSLIQGILKNYDKALQDINTAISMCMEMDGTEHLYLILFSIRGKVQADLDLGLREASSHNYTDFFDVIVPADASSTQRLEHIISIHDLSVRIERSTGEPSIDDYLERGIAYVETDQPEAGIADLTRVIENKPTCVRAYLARSNAYRQINQTDDYLNDFCKAIEIDPNFTEE